MDQDDSTHSMRRRQLMKGAAWAAPSAAVAMTAPAYAASSPCTPTLNFSGGLTYNQGKIATGSTNTTTTQSARFGGETFVYNLPQNVTVSKITYQFWIQNRIGQDSHGPGLFYLANTTSSVKGSCASAPCSVGWTPTAGSGFVNKVTSTANLRTTQFPNGQSVPAWDVNMTWDPAVDTRLSSRYTKASGTENCRNFDTGESSGFVVTYTNVPALNQNDIAKGLGSFLSMVTVTVTLSNGQTLTDTQQAE